MSSSLNKEVKNHNNIYNFPLYYGEGSSCAKECELQMQGEGSSSKCNSVSPSVLRTSSPNCGRNTTCFLNTIEHTKAPSPLEGERPASRGCKRERYPFNASRSREGWGEGLTLINEGGQPWSP